MAVHGRATDVVINEGGAMVVPASVWSVEGVLPLIATDINVNTIHVDAGMGHSMSVKEDDGSSNNGAGLMVMDSLGLTHDSISCTNSLDNVATFFASIFNGNTPKMMVNISVFINDETISGAEVAIPMVVVEEMSARERIVLIDIEGDLLSLRLGPVGGEVIELEDNKRRNSNNFIIRAKELSVWSPTLNDNKEVDDYSEDDSSKRRRVQGIGKFLSINSSEGLSSRILEDANPLNDHSFLPVSNQAKLLVVSIYAPQSITSKRSLWSYISSLISRWDGHLYGIGDLMNLMRWRAFGFMYKVARVEVRNAVWGCGENKSPGPDGFTF
ncbi:hypothetical protein Tco_0257469 [Tanacetum coccineum]